MTQALLKSTKTKQKLYKKFIKNPTVENKTIFTNYRNKYKLVRIKTEQNYYISEFTKYNSDIKKPGKLLEN